MHIATGQNSLALKLHNDRYSNIANPFETEYQNSNQWLLTMIAAAQSGKTTIAENVQFYRSAGYVPSQVYVSGGRSFMKALGDIFGAATRNVHFGDHTRAERRSGWYNFVSAASLFFYLDKTDELIADEILCLDWGCDIPVEKLDSRD